MKILPFKISVTRQQSELPGAIKNLGKRVINTPNHIAIKAKELFIRELVKDELVFDASD